MKADAGAWVLRAATSADLDAVNAVVERAVMTWALPERVKRLSLPSYRYSEHDLEMLELVVAEEAGASIVGVAAWEQASPGDVPPGQIGLLLHGLYVDPVHQHRGIGSGLLDAAVRAARARGLNGLLVKAQADAEAFFLKLGLEKLPVRNSRRDYARRLWLALAP